MGTEPGVTTDIVVGKGPCVTPNTDVGTRPDEIVYNLKKMKWLLIRCQLSKVSDSGTIYSA